MNFGLVVDYSAHIAHHFMTTGGTPRERAARAINEMGSSVFNGKPNASFGRGKSLASGGELCVGPQTELYSHPAGATGLRCNDKENACFDDSENINLATARKGSVR